MSFRRGLSSSVDKECLPESPEQPLGKAAAVALVPPAVRLVRQPEGLRPEKEGADYRPVEIVASEQRAEILDVISPVWQVRRAEEPEATERRVELAAGGPAYGKRPRRHPTAPPPRGGGVVTRMYSADAATLASSPRAAAGSSKCMNDSWHITRSTDLSGSGIE